jgi:hypothetical protein
LFVERYLFTFPNHSIPFILEFILPFYLFKYREYGRFKGERDIKTTWNSIKVSANGIGVGSLFNIAYEYGYVKDKKHLFTGVDNTVDIKMVYPHCNT